MVDIVRFVQESEQYSDQACHCPATLVLAAVVPQRSLSLRGRAHFVLSLALEAVALGFPRDGRVDALLVRALRCAFGFPRPFIRVALGFFGDALGFFGDVDDDQSRLVSVWAPLERPLQWRWRDLGHPLFRIHLRRGLDSFLASVDRNQGLVPWV